jgi:hypothetical protein
MAYATPDQLATALEIRVTEDNQQLLEDCLGAAATEIDHFLVDADPSTVADIAAGNVPTIVTRVNVNRAVEWYKAPATFNGGIGMTDIGTMTAPASGFERYTAVLLPLRLTWGIA